MPAPTRSYRPLAHILLSTRCPHLRLTVTPSIRRRLTLTALHCPPTYAYIVSLVIYDAQPSPCLSNVFATCLTLRSKNPKGQGTYTPSSSSYNYNASPGRVYQILLLPFPAPNPDSVRLPTWTTASRTVGPALPSSLPLSSYLCRIASRVSILILTLSAHMPSRVLRLSRLLDSLPLYSHPRHSLPPPRAPYRCQPMHRTRKSGSNPMPYGLTVLRIITYLPSPTFFRSRLAFTSNEQNRCVMDDAAIAALTPKIELCHVNVKKCPFVLSPRSSAGSLVPSGGGTYIRMLYTVCRWRQIYLALVT